MKNASLTRTTQTKKPTAPERSSGTPRFIPIWSESKITLAHMLLRLFFALAFVLLIDISVSTIINAQTDQAFENDYRFANGTDIAPLHLYVEHIRNANNADISKIAFLGSSPTYGHRIKNSANTYPYVFERELNSLAKTRSKVYNLASNGQLIADQYYIAEALINDVDSFVIQLNYHTFNKDDDKRPAIRYPDISKRLGLKQTDDEMRLLGVKSSLSSEFNSTLSRTFASACFTFTERDFITGKLFGGPPENRLLQILPKTSNKVSDGKTGKKDGGDEIFGETNKPFEELSTAQRMIIIKRVSELYDFKIDENDRELVFLRKLIDLISSHKKKAVFFITPLNIEALDEFGLFNWDAYDSNSQILRRMVESKNLRFIDANAAASGDDYITPEHFFDISHALDSGGIVFGKQLASDSKEYLSNPDLKRGQDR